MTGDLELSVKRGLSVWISSILKKHLTIAKKDETSSDDVSSDETSIRTVLTLTTKVVTDFWVTTFVVLSSF